MLSCLSHVWEPGALDGGDGRWGVVGVTLKVFSTPESLEYSICLLGAKHRKHAPHFMHCVCDCLTLPDRVQPAGLV